MSGQIIYDLLIILSAGTLAGLVCRRLKVSVLVGYLVIGTLLGSGLLGLVIDENHEIEHLAEAGVFFLLFSIGLEFSLEELFKLGRNLLIGGALQMLLVAAPVAGLLLLAGASPRAALLIGSAVAFSSTVLVFKALAERGHSNTPHGRRAIGILLFQDAALVPLLLLVPLLTRADEQMGGDDLLWLALNSAFFVGGFFLVRQVLRRWLLPLLAGFRSPDLMVLFTLTSLGLTTLAAHRMGLPAAVGAFAAGLLFSGTRWSHQIDAFILPFRESFAAVFFVSLGLLFDPRVFLEEPLLMAACFGALILLKAVAASVALRLTGLAWGASLGMGLGLAHVGEFAFVLLMIGNEAGLIAPVDYQRAVSLAIASLLLCPMLLALGLRKVRGTATNQEPAPPLATHHSEKPAIVVGAGPVGRQVASQLETLGSDVCLVDLSPINLHPFALAGFRTVAGDAVEEATLRRAGVASASLVVVCVPDDEVAIETVRSIRGLNRGCALMVRCRYRGNEKRLLNLGANRVVSEETVAAGALMELLAEFD